MQLSLLWSTVISVAEQPGRSNIKTFNGYGRDMVLQQQQKKGPVTIGASITLCFEKSLSCPVSAASGITGIIEGMIHVHALRFQCTHASSLCQQKSTHTAAQHSTALPTKQQFQSITPSYIAQYFIYTQAALQRGSCCLPKWWISHQSTCSLLKYFENLIAHMAEKYSTSHFCGLQSKFTKP